MKYAVLFAFAGVLLVLLAVAKGGWYLLLLWPALSLLAISLAYFRFGAPVFGKRIDGTIAAPALVVLLPYLVYLWCVWHVVRILSREAGYNRIADNLTIGRRLLASELPDDIEVVVDLTCEFVEPRAVRTSREYLSFPLLDGIAPSAPSIVSIARQISEDRRHLFIHCAQGHGRTGLVAAALLLARGTAKGPEAAIEMIRSMRPGVRLSSDQMACLQMVFAILKDESGS